MDYICKKDCYFRKKVWRQGEILAAQPGEVLPKYFEIHKEVAENPPVEEKIITISSLSESDALILETKRMEQMQSVSEQQQIIPKKRKG